MIMVCHYVDDILVSWSRISEMNKFKKVMMNAFETTGLGNMVYFLGMKILHSENGIIMHQLKYELDLLKRFELIVTPSKINHKPYSDDEGEDIDATTFKPLVGCLRCLCNTRPDICYTVGIVSRFMDNPKWSHY